MGKRGNAKKNVIYIMKGENFMKKVLVVFIFSFSIFIRNTYAETFYGEYYKVDNIDGLNEDLIKIDSYKIYNTFKLEYEDMGYMMENDDYLKDEDDYIYEESLVNEYRDSDTHIKINTTYENMDILHFNYLSENIKIYEVEFYYKNEKINYTINNLNHFLDINQLDITNINDGNYDTYYTNIITHQYLRACISFNLLKMYNLNDLKIVVYTKQGDNSDITMVLDNYKYFELYNNIDRKHIITFNTVDKVNENVEYFYKERIKLYKYYKENKIILNNYVREGDNLILDDYNIVNEYYKRDKIILKDDFIINNKDMTIDDFIEYSSGNLVKDCDINYDVNGKYNCKFILNDIKIEKEVIVDIEDNYEVFKENVYEIIKDNTLENKTIEEKNNTDNKLINHTVVYEEINESTNIIDNTNKEEKTKLKKKNNTKKVSMPKKENKNDDLTDEKKCEINLKHNKNEKLIKLENSKKDKLNIIFKILLFIIIFFLEILFIIKKKKR